MMIPLIATLSVPILDQSPFCRDLASLDNFRDAFISYCSRTFNNDDMSGNNDTDLNAADGDVGDDGDDGVNAVDGDVGDDRGDGGDGGGGDNNEFVLDRIRDFAGGLFEEDDSGVVNRGEK